MRQIREHLAIEFDFGFPQSADETAVGDTVVLGSRGDACDPKLSDHRFGIAAIACREHHCALHGLARGAIKLASSADEALGAL